MSSYITIVDFLPKDTYLKARINPSKDLSIKAEWQLEVDHSGFQKIHFALIQLKETLKIKFYISSKWNIQKRLEPCKCTSPIFLGKTAKSLNGLYQDISAIIEPHRNSRGGNVYDKIYFQDHADCQWRSLEYRREQVFEIYRSDYEEMVNFYKKRTPSYVPIPFPDDVFQHSILTHEENLIEILKAENSNLHNQVKQLTKLFEKSKLNLYQNKIQEFEQRLQQSYPETKGEESWQKWIYQNSWLFATQYGSPLPRRIRGGRNQIPDFLFPTLDGFVDILEIKKPEAEVLIADKGHPGAYRLSGISNQALGQVINYLNEVEQHSSGIIRDIQEIYSIEVNALKPRAIILIGKSENWKRLQKVALREINNRLNQIEIITYTDLLQRSKNILKIYSNRL